MATPDENVPLSSALAPDASSLYDVVEGHNDPLESELVVEEPMAEPQLPDASLGMPSEDNLAKELLDVGMEIPNIETGKLDQVDIDESPDDSILDLNDKSWEDVLPEDQIDYANPGELVAAVLQKAREFTKFSDKSNNSMRRAVATCDLIEKMIVAGVTADAKHQALTLAQLELLDSIEEGVQYSKASLTSPRKVEARLGDKAIYYDPFCATVARILINGQVQGGKKVQDLFKILSNKYSIDKREELQISSIMNDMGYPVRSLIDGEDMIEQQYA